jgi:hypothetical protein
MKNNPDFYIAGGISGILGTICYMVAITISFSPPLTFLIAMSWPILSIIFAFSVYTFILNYRQSILNQLAFLFTCMAFVLVSIMLSVQLVVKTGLEGSINQASGEAKDTLRLIYESMRWIDLGVDLAWDLYLGTALILLSLVLKKHPKFGLWLGIILLILAVALITFNLLYFPDPPDRLFDVGPLIGIFIIVLASRIVYLGIRQKSASSLNTPETNTHRNHGL